MKKFFFSMLAIMMVFGVSTVMTSCDEETLEDFKETIHLIGRWEITKVTPSDGEQSVFTVGDRWNFQGNDFTDNRNHTGSWRLSGKTIYLTYKDKVEETWGTMDSYEEKQFVLKTVIKDVTYLIEFRRLSD